MNKDVNELRSDLRSRVDTTSGALVNTESALTTVIMSEKERVLFKVAQRSLNELSESLGQPKTMRDK